MNASRVRMLVLAAGLLAARSALAETITVYARMAGSGAVGRVDGPAGIACRTDGPANCVGTVTAGGYTLAPADVSNATFVGWSGCSSVTGTTCNLNVSGYNKTVTANFKPTTYALQVKSSASSVAFGWVQATGVSCSAGTAPAWAATTTFALDARVAQGGVQYRSLQAGNLNHAVTDPAWWAVDTQSCDTAVANGAPFTLTAGFNATTVKVAWTGCSSNPSPSTCAIASMTSARMVTASFTPNGYVVTAQINGRGTITAPASTGGNPVRDAMACPGDCTSTVAPSGTITLTATPAADAKLVGWTGCSSNPTPATCAVVVTASAGVTATFEAAACNACHSVPPLSHENFANNTACGSCHPGYTQDSVNAATHMDGNLDLAGLPPPSAPAGFGFNVEVIAASVGDPTATPPVKPYVDIKATDAAGNVLDVIALINGGEFTSSTGSSRIPRFSLGETLADGSFKPRLMDTSKTPPAVVTSETSAAARYTAQGNGVYRYTFSDPVKVLAPIDTSKSYRAVVYGARFWKPANLPSVQYPNSDYLDWSPAGTLVAGKETVDDAACNACHGKLTLHGMRRGVAICLTCHNINTALGSGNTDTFKWDLKNLVHKLHSGKNYTGTKPDGTTGSGWGTTFDASEIKMAPSHSTYLEAGTGTTVLDPGLMGAECGVCHQGANAGYAFSRPTRFACGSCHDAVNFTTGAGHDGLLAGAQPDDSACAGCHSATSTSKYHSRFYESVNNADLTTLTDFPAGGHTLQVAITGVSVDSAGRPTFTIQAQYKTGTGAMAPANLAAWAAAADANGAFKLPTCAFTIAGPTTDYQLPATGSTTVSCTAASTSTTGLVSTGTPGEFTVAQLGATGFFSGKSGAYTLGFEIMMQRVWVSGTAIVRKPFAANPVFYTVAKDGTGAWVATARGSNANDRRAVVSFDKCNSCHVDLGFHSNRGRKGPDYCALCHNPKLDNGTRIRFQATETDTGAVGGKVLPESVSMNIFIHRLHMGSELASVQDKTSASPWVTFPGEIKYGSNRTATDPTPGAEGMADFTAFAMPNDMGRCDQCHLTTGDTAQGPTLDAKTWALPTIDGLAPIERSYRLCDSTDANGWCVGRTKGALVVTPPLKAVCTSCHDSAATNAHADVNTVNPMTAGADELCASCHGPGQIWDSIAVHPPIP